MLSANVIYWSIIILIVLVISYKPNIQLCSVCNKSYTNYNQSFTTIYLEKNGSLIMYDINTNYITYNEINNTIIQIDIGNRHIINYEREYYLYNQYNSTKLYYITTVEQILDINDKLQICERKCEYCLKIINNTETICGFC